MPIFDGEKEARLTALACSTPPEGRGRWTLRLLEGKAVELGIVERASGNTIGRVLKKTRCNLTAKSNGSSRRKQMAASPAFAGAGSAAMEEVLDVYTRPHDPQMPLVCLDESSRQLISETRTPLPIEPGQPQRVDYEYERNGTANMFMLFAPLEGWRHVEVTDRRTAIDYAKILKDLSDIYFPHARKIALVQDNLNTHAKASLYKAFPPAEARRLAERFE